MLLTQYVPSIKLVQVAGERAKLLLGTSNSKGRERLLDLGRIIATDTFLNFSGRFPTLWDSSHKALTDSLLISYNPERVPIPTLLDDKDNPNLELLDLMTINTRCNCFKTDNQVSKLNTVAYLSRLEKFLDGIFADIRQLMEQKVEINACVFDSIAVIKNYLSVPLAYDLTPLGYLEIVFGVVVGYFNIISMGMERMGRLCKNVRGIGLKEVRAEWVRSFDESIELEFFKEVHDLIAYHFQRNLDTVSWALKMVNNTKTIDVFDTENEEGEGMKLEIDETYDLEAKHRREEEEYKATVLAEEAAEKARIEEEMKRRAELLLASPRQDDPGQLEQAQEVDENDPNIVPRTEPQATAPEGELLVGKDARERDKKSSSCCCVIF